MKLEKVNFIVVHCSATPPGMDIGAAEIDAMHKARGWSGIGYHMVIRRNGAVEPGRPLTEIGAHTKGHNYESVGVCMVGGVDGTGHPDNNFTAEQFASLAMQVKSLQSLFPGAQVLGHRDLSPDIDRDGVVERHEWLKDCPCFDVRQWMATL